MNTPYPEHELLLLCARTQLSSAQALRLTMLVRAGVDWERVHQTAVRHHILLLVYHHLKSHCIDDVPPEALARLRTRIEMLSRHNLHLTAELIRFVRLFESEQIGVIPIKGPLLAVSTYNSLLMRQFDDLDVLVQKVDVPRARALIQAQGYHLYREEAHEQRYFEPDYHDMYINRETSIVLELHWGLVNGYFSSLSNADLFWNGGQPAKLGGQTVTAPSNEDMLLYLCWHGYKHHWSRLSWICDIAEMVNNSPDLNWAYIERQAQQKRGRLVLWLGLRLAHDVLEAMLPAAILEKIQREFLLTKPAALIQAHLFQDAPTDTNDVADYLDRYTFHLTLREGRFDRLRYVLHIIYRRLQPTAKDYEALRLPKSLAFLYPIVRPFRLLRDYGRQLLGQSAPPPAP